jgi:hypothetical protein
MWKQAKATTAVVLAGTALAMAEPTRANPDPTTARITFSQGAPVGLTGFKWTNELSYSFEGFDRLERIRSDSPLRLLGVQQNRRDPDLPLMIEAGRRVYFEAEIANWRASCSTAFSFIPLPGAAYRIAPERSESGDCTPNVIDASTGVAPTSLEVRP